MKKINVKKIAIAFASTILITGIILKNGRLYIFDYGFLEENKVSFGLIELLNLKEAVFYELNIFYCSVFCFIFIVLNLILLNLYEKKGINSSIFFKISLVTCAIAILVLALNFESFELVRAETKKYSLKLFGFLNDSISTNYWVKTRLNSVSLGIFTYSIIICILSFILFNIAGISRIRNKFDRINEDQFV